MLFLYNILVCVVEGFLKIIAPFNKKLSLFVKGRENVFIFLAEKFTAANKVIWFHTASLGEFEQGIPIIEQTRKDFPEHKILVTFFSPSGYEVKKHVTTADAVCYLPLDTKDNADRFLDIVTPELAIFVKYEFWPNYLSALKKRGVPTLLVSGIFRKDQAFFHWYGGFMRKSLQTFNHFFVQNEKSKALLEQLHFNNVTISGDTRFDRVVEILERDNTLAYIKEFKGDNHLCFVAGSTWPEDEKVIVDYINKNNSKKLKYIIAPHTIQPSAIQKLHENIHKKTVLFSEKEGKVLFDYEVFIVDTIGILTKIYSYADIAYVGGGMGNTGLHNTLEPAVFGIPVLIGKHFKGFIEVEQLVELGGVISIKNKKQFFEKLNYLIENQSVSSITGQKNMSFIKKNTGAKIQIGHWIRKLIVMIF